MQYQSKSENVMASDDELFEILDGLIDGWCEKRALNPLRRILAGYPMPSMLTDSWDALYEALRDVRAFCRDELSETELELVGKAVLMVQIVLDRTYAPSKK
jgi:hypothetical protein